MHRVLTALTVAVLSSAPTLAAQRAGDPALERPAPTAGPKSPTAARILGVFPGAGHLYAGEPRRGLVFIGRIVGVGVLGGFVTAGECASQGPYSEDCATTALDIAFAAVFIGVWGWSIYDAGRAAQRTNVRRGFRASVLVRPVLAGSASTGAATRLFLGVAVRGR